MGRSASEVIGFSVLPSSSWTSAMLLHAANSSWVGMWTGWLDLVATDVGRKGAQALFWSMSLKGAELPDPRIPTVVWLLPPGSRWVKQWWRTLTVFVAVARRMKTMGLSLLISRIMFVGLLVQEIVVVS